jgi:hypothetical protein
MKLRSALVPAILLLTSGFLAACQPDAGSAPQVTLSPTRVPAKGHVEMTGSGFTPMANVTSHLLKPDGTEFPWLPMLTDSNGEITHDIDTLLLAPGTHEVWVVDDTTGVSSNVARFELTLDQPTPE